MTNKQIKQKAMEHLGGKWGTCIALTVFKVAFVSAFLCADVLIFLLFKDFGIEYGFTPAFFLGSDTGRFLTVVHVIILLFIFSPENYILRRLYLDLFQNRNFIETRRFLQYNSRKVQPKAAAATALIIMLKFFAAVPLMISCYGIWYWGFHRAGDSLTTASLFIFMLSIGFSLVWVGVLIHYSISLSLTKYIMCLNPRANVFDACDLSVRLMDGQHTRYLSLLLSFFKYIPLLLTFYPLFMLMPYFRMSFMVFAEDVMGSYWQDKYPAMIKRWNKYVR
ncbi:MAG: hypothetical protein IJ561_01725 [Ruminococcus sp.]|nr:hypothetical protein [Ruminococcus sp.]